MKNHDGTDVTEKSKKCSGSVKRFFLNQRQEIWLMRCPNAMTSRKRLPKELIHQISIKKTTTIPRALEKKVKERLTTRPKGRSIRKKKPEDITYISTVLQADTVSKLANRLSKLI